MLMQILLHASSWCYFLLTFNIADAKYYIVGAKSYIADAKSYNADVNSFLPTVLHLADRFYILLLLIPTDCPT